MEILKSRIECLNIFVWSKLNIHIWILDIRRTICNYPNIFKYLSYIAVSMLHFFSFNQWHFQSGISWQQLVWTLFPSFWLWLSTTVVRVLIPTNTHLTHKHMNQHKQLHIEPDLPVKFLSSKRTFKTTDKSLFVSVRRQHVREVLGNFPLACFVCVYTLLTLTITKITQFILN